MAVLSTGDIAIRAEGLAKSYLIGHQMLRQRETFREMITRTVRGVGRTAFAVARGQQIVYGDTVEEFWALKDVSFEVKRGEVLGVIGRNGAGKSTLLKILSRITEPTGGRAVIRGRVASLLEVGTGFHAELTGRENIYLNGAILGMTRAEIKKRFDEIIAFAEVEKFLDTPVKHYSSGMYVRLAFAVAAHLEPEILIVDEVLAVGDVTFQKKCLGKMESIASGAGRTVLFVSHNMTAVMNLCQNALLLEAGRITASGDAGGVTDKYLSAGTSEEIRLQSWPDLTTAPGDDRIRVRKVEIANYKGRRDPLDTESPLSVIIEHWNLRDGANTIIELMVRAADGAVVFHSFSSESIPAESVYRARGLFRTQCLIPDNLLNAGLFYLEVYFLHGTTSNYYAVAPACTFSIADTGARPNLDYYGRFAGHVHPKLEWRVVPLTV